MKPWSLGRPFLTRRGDGPLRLEAGATTWTATWTPHRRDGAATPARILLPAPAYDALPETADRFGRLLADALRTAGFHGAEAVLTIPLDWTAAFRADRPESLADGDAIGFLDLQAERAAPFGGAGWRLAPPTFGEPAEGVLTAAILPESRALALDRVAAAAGLRWVSLRPDAPARRPSDPPASLDLGVADDCCTIVARRHGRAVDWVSLPAATPSDRAELSANLGLFLSALPPDWRAASPAARWFDAPAVELRDVVESRLRAAGLGFAEAPAPEGALPYEFIRARVSVEPGWLRTVRTRLPRRGRRALLAAAALLLLVLAARWLIETTLRARATRLAPIATESADLLQRMRRYRPWLEADGAGAGALDALAAVFPEDGRVWARRVELRDRRRIVCTGAARTQADAVALMERLRRAPGVRDVQAQYLRGGEPAQFAFEFEWRAAP